MTQIPEDHVLEPTTLTASAGAGDDSGSAVEGGLLEVRGVRRAFGAVVALDDVNLTIRDNEFFALLGPSGCGKTTLLRAIAGFEVIDSGEILLGGEDLHSSPPERRPVNLMFQSYALFPHMTVAKNIAYGLERERRPRAEVAERVATVMAAMQISELAKRRPSQLSGGQQQRVALARAIVKRPRLLLLDEPLSALDRQVRLEMRVELKRLQHEFGITFVMVTHDQEEALSMADRVAVMAAGRVQQLDTPVGLYRNPANLFVAGFVGASNLLVGVVRANTFDSEHFGSLPLPSNPKGVARGHLVLRPEDVRIVAPGEGHVQAVVSDVQFHGAATTVLATSSVPGAPMLVAMVTGLAQVTPGDRVGLHWDTGLVVEDALA